MTDDIQFWWVRVNNRLEVAELAGGVLWLVGRDAPLSPRLVEFVRRCEPPVEEKT